MVRRLAVLAILAWVVTAAPAALAGPLDTCAQRVIRDWYSGGRVSGAYPLPCYRAAIEALPADVLAYSEADRDIARALAFARRGRAETPSTAPARSPEPPPARSAQAEPPQDAGESSAPPPAAEPRPEVTPRPSLGPREDAPSRLASGPSPTDVSATVPYPVIVLAALAGTLLLTGAVGWAFARRR